jgi:predicted transcriptional regulator
MPALRRDYHTEAPVTFRAPGPIREWLDGHAERTGQSRSAVIIAAIERLRDHAAPSASEANGNPEAIDRT